MMRLTHSFQLILSAVGACSSTRSGQQTLSVAGAGRNQWNYGRTKEDDQETRDVTGRHGASSLGRRARVGTMSGNPVSDKLSPNYMPPLVF